MAESEARKNLSDFIINMIAAKFFLGPSVKDFFFLMDIKQKLQNNDFNLLAYGTQYKGYVTSLPRNQHLCLVVVKNLYFPN